MSRNHWETAISADWQGRLTCGTRLAFRAGPQDYRVVCATCHEGGSVRHATPQAANTAAIRDSARACRACGAS